MECDSVEVLNRAVEIGLGIAILPERTVAKRTLAAGGQPFQPVGHYLQEAQSVESRHEAIHWASERTALMPLHGGGSLCRQLCQTKVENYFMTARCFTPRSAPSKVSGNNTASTTTGLNCNRGFSFTPWSCREMKFGPSRFAHPL